MKPTKIYEINALQAPDLCDIAHTLEQGALAVFATDTVYGLGTGALCETAIREICRLKNRPVTQPLQLLVADIDQAKQVAQFSAIAQQLASAYWPGGLTLIMPPTQQGKPFLRGTTSLGIRVPNHPVLQQLLKHMQTPLCATSANLHGQPVLTRQEDVVQTFTGHVDFILTQGTLTPTASSVVDCTHIPARVLRAGSISQQDIARFAGAK